MLRIILRGRTGNILFQYALGRVLAEKHGVPLVLGAHWYNRDGWAEVSQFLKLPLKATVERGGLPGSIASRALRKLTDKHFWEYLNVPLLCEDHHDHSFDPRFLDAPPDCVLSGYFQSPGYFGSMANELRKEINGLISIGARTSRPNADINQLLQPCSVAVHVRRGDYLQIPVFQVCDSRYYHQSINEMRTRVPDARFYIFSDDPDWCRGEFRDPDITVIDSGTASSNPLHDLHLMSLASHHIIANSSYSWWGAWLGRKPGQIVVCPPRWFAVDGAAPIEDKLCPGWEIGPSLAR